MLDVWSIVRKCESVVSIHCLGVVSNITQALRLCMEHGPGRYRICREDGTVAGKFWLGAAADLEADALLARPYSSNERHMARA